MSSPAPALAASDATQDGRSPRTPAGFLVGPGFDLFFVANLAWPLILLLQVWGGFDTHDGVRFWQIYFVTTPHRWITLALVFFDNDRFRKRSGSYLIVLAAIILFCLSVRISTGRLTCLLMIDYVWNAWHFAAQHHGIYRIYDRLAGPLQSKHPGIDKIVMRMFLVYVAVRIAGWSWSLEELDRWLMRADWGMLAIPAWMIVREGRRLETATVGRGAYLISVLGLYLAMLFAVHDRRPGLLLMLATASALFHAVEYLAVVSWFVRRQHDPQRGRRTLLSLVVPQWGLALAAFVVVIGTGARLLETQWMQFWLLLNVIVAFLHYAYDGMIWKTRRSSSPRAD